MDQQLLQAIKNGNLERVKYLIETHNCGELGWRPLAEDPHVALCWAAQYGHLEIIKYLIESHHCDPHVESEFALCWAADNGHLEIVKYLIEECNCDYSVNNEAPLRFAAKNGRLEVLKYLIETHNCDPHVKSEEALRFAAENGHFEIVQYLIGVCKCDPHTQEEYALRWAANNGHIKVVKYLIGVCKCDPHVSDILEIKEAPLRWAVRNGHLEMVKYLIEKCLCDPHVNSEGALRYAAENGHFEIVQYLIEKCQCDPHVSDSVGVKEYVLRFAAKNGHIEIVKYLIEKCLCDYSVKSEEALRFAAENGHLEMVKYLIEECNCDPHVNEELALRLGVINGQLQVTKYLIGVCMCDIHVQYNNDNTVYDLLQSFNHPIAQSIIQNYDQFQNQCYWLKQIINQQKVCYAPESTKWQKMAGTLGTHQLESLRSIVQKLQISYEECNENKLYEKRLLCKLLAQDLESYQIKYNTISKRSNRYKSINETNLMGETNIPDFRYLYNLETRYFYDLNEIKQLNGICPYTRIPFSETFLKEINEKEKEYAKDQVRHEIHKMYIHKKENQYTIWKKSIINNIAKIEEKTNCYFPSKKVMRMNVSELKKVQDYLKGFLPKITSKNKMEYLSKLTKQIEKGETEAIVTYLNAYLETNNV